MYELLILSLGVLILFVIALITSKGDFFSPSLIACGLFLLATLMAMRDIAAWRITSVYFSFDATLILLLGLTTFVITELVLKNFLMIKSYSNKDTVKELYDTKPLCITRTKIWLMIICVTGFTGLYCLVMYKIAAQHGYSGLFQLTAIATFRHDLSFSTTDNYQIPRWLRIGKMIVDANVYVCIYFLTRNLFYAKDKLRKNWPFLFVIALSVPTCIINSSRGSLLQMAGSFVFLAYIMMRRRTNWKKPSKTFMKILRWSIVLFVLVIVGFYLIQANGLFGRTTQRSLLDHITMYIGAPIIHFYQFISNPPSDVLYPGEETFAAFNKTLVRLGIIANSSSSQLEMRAIGDHAGNIYTFFRRPYHDFGLIGMIIVTAITSGIFTTVYYKKIYKKMGSSKTDCCAIIYSYFFYIIYLMPMMCDICNLVYVGIIIFVFFIYFVYGFTMDKFGIRNHKVYLRKW